MPALAVFFNLVMSFGCGPAQVVRGRSIFAEGVVGLLHSDWAQGDDMFAIKDPHILSLGSRFQP